MNEIIAAKSEIKGSEKYPGIHGSAAFVTTDIGTMATISVYGLPESSDPCEYGVFGVHIHAGNSCSGTAGDPFANTLSHYDKNSCPHPYHTGDMPPLFSCNGTAHNAFVTCKFTPADVIGKTVVIHLHPDDMHTQPSGNSGEKIACGEITAMTRSD